MVCPRVRDPEVGVVTVVAAAVFRPFSSNDHIAFPKSKHMSIYATLNALL